MRGYFPSFPKMYNLQTPELNVSVLDPVEDQSRLGSRYCAGGYIYQVEDKVLGELLSGPEFPVSDPSPFNGQGLPEAFEIALGQDKAKVGEDVMVLGVGLVTRVSPIKPFHVRHNPSVKTPASWIVQETPGSLSMVTEQVFGSYALEMVREIRLDGRAVGSHTKVRNLGSSELPLRWFAHPFFPLMDNWECCQLSLEFKVDENPGFRRKASGLISMNSEFNWEQGCFLPLNLPMGFPLTITQRHPKVGQVQVECAFALAGMPIWANNCTFSFEPYFHTVLKPGGEADWAITYRF